MVLYIIARCVFVIQKYVNTTNKFVSRLEGRPSKTTLKIFQNRGDNFEIKESEKTKLQSIRR